ncbi:hypothetical protein MRY87_08570 [bacterium]|nr:hypothetical protein [bacterium]
MSGEKETAGKPVFARGIAEGLVVRLDRTVEPLTLQAALRDFMISRSGFLRGSAVFLDWFGGDEEGAKAPAGLSESVRSILKKEFHVEAKPLPSKLRSKVEVLRGAPEGDEDFLFEESVSDEAGSPHFESEDGKLRLFDGFSEEDGLEGDQERSPIASRTRSVIGSSREMSFREGGDISVSEKEAPTQYDHLGYALEAADVIDDEMLGDVADARVVVGTLRSGQRVESEHTLLVAGDVNSGAEVIAGGDIFILGKLRGVAHAGAYDETGAGRVIFALELEPTQLRIGSVITRGGESKPRPRTVRGGATAELARVDGNMILVEPYQNRRVRRS